MPTIRFTLEKKGYCHGCPALRPISLMCSLGYPNYYVWEGGEARVIRDRKCRRELGA